MSASAENRNEAAFLDFKKNPSLQDALSDVNVGDEFTAEVTFCLISQDSKGMACSIEKVIPEGYQEDEDGERDIPSTSPAGNQPPGYLGSGSENEPVITAMRLKKKGSQ